MISSNTITYKFKMYDCTNCAMIIAQLPQSIYYINIVVSTNLGKVQLWNYSEDFFFPFLSPFLPKTLHKKKYKYLSLLSKQRFLYL